MASLRRGLCYFEVRARASKDDSGLRAVTNKRVILSQLTARIETLSTSFKNKTLAVVTEDRKLHVFDVTNNHVQRSFDLPTPDMRDLRIPTIEWVQNSVVVVCYPKQLLFYSNGQAGSPMELSFISEVSSRGTHNFLVRTEVDGLRVIAIASDGAARNVIVRKIGKEFNSVKSMISCSAGFYLYKSYKDHLKHRPPDNYILNDRQKVSAGVDELLEALKFELRPEKQKKILSAAVYAKTFIGGDYHDRDCILNICKIIKIVTNL